VERFETTVTSLEQRGALWWCSTAQVQMCVVVLSTPRRQRRRVRLLRCSAESSAKLGLGEVQLRLHMRKGRGDILRASQGMRERLSLLC
jgi:hypothetical protein